MTGGINDLAASQNPRRSDRNTHWRSCPFAPYWRKRDSERGSPGGSDHGRACRSETCRPRRRLARRQIHRHRGSGFSQRHAGAGAPAAGPDPARPRRRAEHWRLHLGLSRLAGRRLRSRAAAGEEAPRRPRCRLPARRQRGTGGDRGVGLAAGRAFARRPQGRRLRYMVRQRPRRRSQRRRLQARQFLRHLEARRRAGGRRRRPQRQILHRRAPVRPRDDGCDHAGAVSDFRARIHRTRPARHRHVAAIPACGSGTRSFPIRSRPPASSILPAKNAASRCPTISNCRPTASTSAGPTTAMPRTSGCRNTRPMRRSPLPAPTSVDQIVIDSSEAAASASSRPARPTRTCARRCATSASTTRTGRRHRPARHEGRHALAARARGRAPFLRRA